MTYEELERMLLKNKISPQKFIEEFNELMEQENKKHRESMQPHEHI